MVARPGLPDDQRSSRFLDEPGRTGTWAVQHQNVIGANEWQENIDNNAYTNGMLLPYCATLLRRHELYRKPIPTGENVAKHSHPPDGTTRENATYNGEVIKQADANLLAYPMKIVAGEKRIARTWSMSFALSRKIPMGVYAQHARRPPGAKWKSLSVIQG